MEQGPLLLIHSEQPEKGVCGAWPAALTPVNVIGVKGHATMMQALHGKTDTLTKSGEGMSGMQEKQRARPVVPVLLGAPTCLTQRSSQRVVRNLPDLRRNNATGSETHCSAFWGLLHCVVLLQQVLRSMFCNPLRGAHGSVHGPLRVCTANGSVHGPLERARSHFHLSSVASDHFLVVDTSCWRRCRRDVSI